MSEYFDSTSNRVVAGSLAKSNQVNDLRDEVGGGFNKLPASAEIKEGRANFGVESGTGNNFVVTMPYSITTYVAGSEISFNPTHANTGAANVDVDGIGSIAIKRPDGTALVAGDIVVGQIVKLTYNGTDFVYTGSQPISFYNEADTARNEAISARDTAVAKEALMNPHYTAIDNVDANMNDVNTVAANDADISTVAANDANVTKVANIDNNVTTVAANDANVTKVANIDTDVTAVANIDTDVTAVSGNNANVSTVATNLNKGAASEVDIVATNITNVNKVGAIDSDVSTVAANDANVTTVATNITDVQNAEGNALLAKDYANKAEDAQVETGTYSSLHFSKKSEASASAAATSEGNAQTYQNNALSAKNAAETAQGAAETAQGAAETAQGAAETARSGAETAYDNFDDRYLGQKASDPTLDNDGAALLTGALYWNTTNDRMMAYDGSVWRAAYINYIWEIISANQTAEVMHGYLVDCSAGARSLTLPGSPSLGDRVFVKDATGNAGTNNIIIYPNGNFIENAGSALTLSIDNDYVELVFGTNNWSITQRYYGYAVYS